MDTFTRRGLLRLMDLSVILKCLLVFSLVQGSIATTAAEYPDYVAKTYAGAWTTESATFSRYSNQTMKNYYYDTIEMNVAEKGLYTFTSKSSVSTSGFIYKDSFDPSNLDLNLVTKADGNNRKRQFKILATLEPDQKYILVVAASNPEVTGNFSIILFGPTTVNILSKIKPKNFALRQDVTTAAPYTARYVGALTYSSPLFHRPDDDDDRHYFHYQAIRVSAVVAGEYTFECKNTADLDTYGYFYRLPFDPARPLNNLVTEDDDNGGELLQFKLSAYLQPGRFFILVVTTHPDCAVGNFTIQASGPGMLTLASSSATPSQPITGTCTLPNLQTTYSGSLSSSSQTFNRPDMAADELYYFRALQITATAAGTYVIRSQSNSDLDTIGLLYGTNFDPSTPNTNLIYEDDDGSEDHLQFEIQEYFRPGTVYFLVITTHIPLDTGDFSIMVYGPAAVTIAPVTPATSQPIVTPTTRQPPTLVYSGALSPSSQIYIRPGGSLSSAYYLQALEVSISTNGIYMFTSDSRIDTMGYFYQGQFDPSTPGVSLIAEDDDDGDIIRQFRIQLNLNASATNILVITTHGSYEKGNFSILASGPSVPVLRPIVAATTQAIPLQTTTPTILTSYSNSLTFTSSIFYRPDGDNDQFYYFRPVQLTVSRTGQYIFDSSSGMDTVGYLYMNSFDPSSPTDNLENEDDDDGDEILQFRIQAYLHSGRTYVLVITTHRPYDTGRFTVRARGPATVSFSYYSPSTSQPITTPSTPPSQVSSYPGELSVSSQVYYRPDSSSSVFYYFQAFRISVTTNGFYAFQSNSSIDTRGYIYGYSFDPSDPLTNLFMDNDDGGSNYQFRLFIYLYTFRTYHLVVSTHKEFITGNYTVVITGAGSATLTPVTPVTSKPITTQATTPNVPTSLPGELSATSPFFYRPDSTGRDYYYFQAYQVVASTAGQYKFTSLSSFDTRGYLYEVSFDPSLPKVNKIDENDDGIGVQFRIDRYLQAGLTYIIVVTTHREYVKGNFTILVTGPTSVTLTPINPATSSPITVPPTTATIPSSYQGELTLASQSYVRPSSFVNGTYYYQALEIIPNIAGQYAFKSTASFDTRGFLYEIYFDANNPNVNLVADNDDGGGYPNFRITYFLQAQQAYTLIVTTHSPSVIGSFSLLATGPGVVRLNPVRPTTMPPPTTTTTQFELASTYLNALLPNSPKFYPPLGVRQDFYYQAIQVTIPISGTYTFGSHAYFDIMGYLYGTNFDPSDSAQGLLAYNSNCGATSDFCMKQFFEAGSKPILVVSSVEPGTTGIYRVRITGPALVDLQAITPQSGKTTPTPRPVSTVKAFATMPSSSMFTIILTTVIILMLRMFQQ